MPNLHCCRLFLFCFGGCLLLFIVIVAQAPALWAQLRLNGLGYALLIPAQALTLSVAHHGHELAANSLRVSFKGSHGLGWRSGLLLLGLFSLVSSLPLLCTFPHSVPTDSSAAQQIIWLELGSPG